MKIRTKILGPFLGMSVLIALIGWFAINQQEKMARSAATTEAKNVGHALGLALISDSNQLDSSAQEIVKRLHATEKRDIVLVNTQKRIVADAIPASIGKIYVEDEHDEVAATLRDGVERTFIEISADEPGGIKQTVLPVQAESGRMLGAVILEYTPLYDELMQSTRKAIYQLVASVIVGLVIAMLTVFYMGRSLAAPLEQLKAAAEGFAAGRINCPMPSSRNDEIGQLAIAFQNMVEKRQQIEMELRHLHDDLEVRVKERTAALALTNDALLAENIERKRAEETLRESEGKFRQLAENISDVFYMTSPDLQQTHYVSPAFEQIWGRSRERLYSHPQEWADAILPEDRERTLAKFAGLGAGESNVSMEFRIARPDGEVRWILSRGFQVRDSAGRVIRITGISSDITERKLAEASLEKLNKELQLTARQAGMAEVATSVLHNVGNVLNSINVSVSVLSHRMNNTKSGSVGKVAGLLKEHETNLADFLCKDTKGRQVPGFLEQLAAQLAEEKVSILEELHSLTKNVDHIKDIVTTQQSYAKVSGVTETVNLTDLAEDALRMNASALIRHDVHFFREYDEHLPEIKVEKHKVLQILVNLIRNAKQSCDESGREDKHLTLRVTNGNAMVSIALTDNGLGIPAENLTRIFNHGFTTKRDGHGFGLHSSALAAREMGGNLQVKSDGLGKGATFTLELPCEPQEHPDEPLKCDQTRSIPVLSI